MELDLNLNVGAENVALIGCFFQPWNNNVDTNSINVCIRNRPSYRCIFDDFSVDAFNVVDRVAILLAVGLIVCPIFSLNCYALKVVVAVA